MDSLKETGQNNYHQEDAWTHTLFVIKNLEKILDESRIVKKVYQASPDNEMLPYLKMAAFFHDLGKVYTRKEKDGQVHYYNHEGVGSELSRKILRGLRFSNKEITFIKDLVAFHMRPLQLFLSKNLTDKGRYRFFNQAGRLTPSVLILSLADRTATAVLNKREEELVCYQNFLFKLLEKYYQMDKQISERLLTGRELKETFSLDEGPLIGKMLKCLKEAQALGRVKTKQEAIEYIDLLLMDSSKSD